MESSAHNEIIKIRPGQESDCFTIFKLIKDLAIYEKMPDQVKITVEGKFDFVKNTQYILTHTHQSNH